MKHFLLFFIKCWVFLLVVTNTPSYAQVASQVVISQVYGGGGNTGATLRNDFIELYNPTSSAVNLAGWSIQYASATGTSWSKTDLSGSIPAYGYYLIQQAQGAGGTTNLPTPDVIGTINMSGTAGKVALRNNNTLITSGTSCVTGEASTVDFVGFGTTANCSEGSSPTTPPSNTNSVIRKTNSTTNNNTFGNAWDSNNNGNDFLAVTAAPRNSSNFAPLFATTPSVANITATGFDLTVRTSKTGNVYVVVVADGETAPSAIQVKNGQNAAGTSLDANLKATISIATANTDVIQSFSGLTGNTAYDVYVLAEDGAPLAQPIATKLDVTTVAGGGSTPTIVVSTASLTDFGSVNNGNQSVGVTYTLSGSDLTGDVSVNAPANFQVSKDGSTWSSLLTYAAGADFTLPTLTSQTIQVRFAPSSGLNGAKTGIIGHSSSGASTQNISVSGTETGNVAPISFAENFNTCNNNTSTFTQISLSGDADFWSCTTFGNGSTNGVQINGGGSGGVSRTNEDWLISPRLTLGTNGVLTFDNKKDFAGNNIVLRVSSNYDGVSLPSTATWTDLSFTLSTNAGSTGSWTASGNVNLNAYNSQNIHLAWVYTSTSTLNSGARWTIDNVNVTTASATYLQTSVNTLPGFGYIQFPNSSTAKTFTVVGTNISQTTQINASAGFEVSKDGTNFSNSISFTPSEILTNQTIHVRFKPTSATGTVVNGNITLTAGTGIGRTVSVSGNEGVNPKNNTLDVVAWNIEWFSITSDQGGSGVGPGSSSSPRNSTQIQTQKDNVKKGLELMDADVYALCEVGNENGVFDALVTEMAAFGYAGFRSPHPVVPSGSYGTDAAKVQRLAFLYKTSVISNVKARPMLSSVNTANLTGYPDSDRTRFWASGRFPYLVTADATINGVTKNIDFVVLHARANGSESSTNQRYAMRRFDVEHLKDSLDANFVNRNLIILGDFNDDVDVTVATPFVPNTESSFKKYVDDASNYRVVSRSLSDDGKSSFIDPPSTNMIDHIMISNELFSDYVSNSATLEDLRNAPFNIASFTTTTSDHLPVSASFTLSNTTTPTPTLVVSTNTLPDFGTVNNGSASSGTSYTLSGSNLTSNVVLTASANFQLSKDGSTWSSTITYAAGVDFTLPTLSSRSVFVRFAPTTGINGVKTGNISHTSTGATTQSISANGTEGGNQTSPVVTGLDAAAQMSSAWLYPNPAQELVYILLPESASSGKVAYQLVDPSGSVLQQATLTTQPNEPLQLWVGNLPNGLYHCILQVGNEKIRKPFVIQR